MGNLLLWCHGGEGLKIFSSYSHKDCYPLAVLFFFMIIWYHRNVVITEKCCQRIRMANGKNLSFFFFFEKRSLPNARILEWVAVPSSRWSSQPRDQTPGLPHCGCILFQLSHKGSPRILKWVTYPFSSGSSQPKNRTRVCCIASGFCNNWAMRKVKGKWSCSVMSDSLRPHGL